MKKILVFSGAGVSAESGISTFRDSDEGLWNKYKVEDVATPQGWKKNRERVLSFYNDRRSEMNSVLPNNAHRIIAELENDFIVTVVTQNIDDLHEKAGSTNVIHLHGEMNKAQSTTDPSLVYGWTKDLNIGDRCEKGSQLRPYVIWFGEMLDSSILMKAKDAAKDADICIIVGTSMSVSPANTLPFLTRETALIYYVNPMDEDDFYIPAFREYFFYRFTEKATTGMEKVKDDLHDIFLSNEKDLDL